MRNHGPQESFEATLFPIIRFAPLQPVLNIFLQVEQRLRSRSRVSRASVQVSAPSEHSDGVRDGHVT